MVKNHEFLKLFNLIKCLKSNLSVLFLSQCNYLMLVNDNSKVV